MVILCEANEKHNYWCGGKKSGDEVIGRARHILGLLLQNFSFKVSAEAVVFFSRPNWEDLPPESHGVGRIQFQSGMTEGFSSWPAALAWGDPQFLATWVSPCLSIPAPASLKPKRESLWARHTWKTVLCNIVTDMTSHHHCHILLLDSNQGLLMLKTSIRTLKDLSVRKWR